MVANRMKISCEKSPLEMAKGDLKRANDRTLHRGGDRAHMVAAVPTVRRALRPRHGLTVGGWTNPATWLWTVW